MTELKTLKDLFVCGLNCKYDHLVKVSELKAEAVKWVRDYNKRYEEAIKNNEMLKVDWFGKFLDFFNLTSEDLK